jgi:hypothetical protein
MSEIEALKAQVDQFSGLRQQVDILTSQIQELQSQMRTVLEPKSETSAPIMADAVATSGKSALQPQSSQLVPLLYCFMPWLIPLQSGSSDSQPKAKHPGLAPLIIGKRLRESNASSLSVAEDGQQTPIRPPSRKRARMDHSDEVAEDKADTLPLDLDAPPIDQLPEFYTPTGPGFGHDPLNFTVSQTPAIFSSFPFPEAPQSPTPVGQSRKNCLLTGGLMPYNSPMAALRSELPITSDSHRSNPSDDVLFLNSPLFDLESAADDAASPSRTMYGTELDVDTRFSEFGLDSIRANMWGNRQI